MTKCTHCDATVLSADLAAADEEARDNLRLIDYIADKIGLPQTDELSRENFDAWMAATPAVGGEIAAIVQKLRKLHPQYPNDIFADAANLIEKLAAQPASPLRGREDIAPTGMIHTLKTWPPYFSDILNGRKPFEWRIDDRNFVVGDLLILQEWEPIRENLGCKEGRYTGREIRKLVSYVFSPFATNKRTVVMGLSASPPEQPPTPDTVKMFVEAIDAKNARLAKLEEALGKAVLSEQRAAWTSEETKIMHDYYAELTGREEIIKECELAARGEVYKEIYNGREGDNWSMDSEYGRGRHAAADAVRALSDQETT